jgi:hypothetical protein
MNTDIKEIRQIVKVCASVFSLSSTTRQLLSKLYGKPDDNATLAISVISESETLKPVKAIPSLLGLNELDLVFYLLDLSDEDLMTITKVLKTYELVPQSFKPSANKTSLKTVCLALKSLDAAQLASIKKIAELL